MKGEQGKMEKETKYLTKKDVLGRGSLITVYGMKTLLNVAAAYDIEKVRFSVVDIGGGGQSHIDIYLDCEEVRQFITEVDNGLAQRKIATETTNYPTTYQWAKGTNGSKRLSIGKGRDEVAVHVYDAQQNANKFIGIKWKDLRELSFMYKLTSGLIPVQAGTYYDTLLAAFIEGSKAFSPSNAETPQQVLEQAVPKTQNEYSDMNVMGSPLAEYAVRTTGRITSGNGYKWVPVIINSTGENTVLVFTEQEASSLSWFQQLDDRLNGGESFAMNIKAARSGKNLRFFDIVKPA